MSRNRSKLYFVHCKILFWNESKWIFNETRIYFSGFFVLHLNMRRTGIRREGRRAGHEAHTFTLSENANNVHAWISWKYDPTISNICMHKISYFGLKTPKLPTASLETSLLICMCNERTNWLLPRYLCTIEMNKNNLFGGKANHKNLLLGLRYKLLFGYA